VITADARKFLTQYKIFFFRLKIFFQKIFDLSKKILSAPSKNFLGLKKYFS